MSSSPLSSISASRMDRWSSSPISAVESSSHTNFSKNSANLVSLSWLPREEMVARVLPHTDLNSFQVSWLSEDSRISENKLRSTGMVSILTGNHRIPILYPRLSTNSEELLDQKGTLWLLSQWVLNSSQPEPRDGLNLIPLLLMLSHHNGTKEDV